MTVLHDRTNHHPPEAAIRSGLYFDRSFSRRRPLGARLADAAMLVLAAAIALLALLLVLALIAALLIGPIWLLLSIGHAIEVAR